MSDPAVRSGLLSLLSNVCSALLSGSFWIIDVMHLCRMKFDLACEVSDL